MTELTDLCREFKVSKASECSGHHSAAFQQFLDVLSRIYYNKNDGSIHNHEHDAVMNNSFTVESWVCLYLIIILATLYIDNNLLGFSLSCPKETK